jgi:hypothetical protein
MRSKNEVLCAAAGRLAGKRSDADKAARAHKTILAPNNILKRFAFTSRTPSAEIITSRTLLSGDNNFTDAGQLVRCHNNEVTLYHYQCSNVIFYGRLKKKYFYGYLHNYKFLENLENSNLTEC